MTWLEFIASIVHSLAWPIVTLVIARQYRSVLCAWASRTKETP